MFIIRLYRCSQSFPEYRLAVFNVQTVLEAVGVTTMQWAADCTVFRQGLENAPLLRAWICNPDEASLLATFGNMTRAEIDAYKALGHL